MFYTFIQNNSGGDFEYNASRGISVYVVVECDSLKEAVELAGEIGIYFNGCDDGRDCDCCGDRWSEPWGKEDLDPVPSMYGYPIADAIPPDKIKWMKGYEGFIHYKDGLVKGFWDKT